MRMTKGLSALAVFVSVGCLLFAEDGHTSLVDNSDDPSPSLIRQWAPQVRLHSREEFFPSSVEDFMSMSYMWYGSKDNNGALANPRQGDVTSETINSFSDPNNGDVKTADRNVPGQFRLILRGEDMVHRQGRTSIKRGENIPPVYVTVHNGTTFDDINYIFFYPYNGPTSKFISGLGAHEGDFEHITVRLRHGTNMLMGIYFSAHGSDESKWQLPGAIEMVGTHPVVYSARSSHANYNKAGRYHRIPHDLVVRTIHFAADKCNNGYSWNTWENVIDVGNYDEPLNGQHWTRFNGRWGRYKDTGCFGFELPFGGEVCFVDYPDEDGSTNLAGKGWFHNVEEGGPR